MKPMTLLILCFVFFNACIEAKVVHSERSLYRNIRVEDDGDLRCLRFKTRNKNSQQSCYLKSNPNYLVFSYTKALLGSLLVQPQPQHILIIGLGGGTMSNTLQQLYPQAHITNVEIDPAVVKVARDYFGYLENQRVSTKVQDGRIFIKRQLKKSSKYDLIILDAFNGDYIPEHLLTREFLQECKQLLTPNGVLAANTFAVSKLYFHESATYADVFGQFLQVKLNNSNNRIILVSQAPLSLAKLQANQAQLADRLQHFGISATSLLKATKQTHDWPENTKILTDQFSPANILNQ